MGGRGGGGALLPFLLRQTAFCILYYIYKPKQNATKSRIGGGHKLVHPKAIISPHLAVYAATRGLN